MIKLYLDGKVVASTYSEDKANPEIAKGETIFAAGTDKMTKFLIYSSLTDRLHMMK